MYTSMFILAAVTLLAVSTYAWGGNDKVLLRDVQTLTLHSGSYTTGRRSKPIPQLMCVGGTAGCKAFTPQVVQCYNRGHDGHDVQWECKADMDNAYRFGQLTVVCEGYDYPDDKYILKGSCGLEYHLELTKEGTDRSSKSSGYEYYSQSYHKDRSKDRSGIGDLIVLAVVGFIIYGIYKTCIANQMNGADSTDGGSGPGTYPQRPSWFGSFFGGGSGYDGYNAPPPPYGFRPDFATDGCGGGASQGSHRGSGGSFWTGAATGGFLGYMLGNRNQRTAYPSGTAYGDAWGGTSSHGSSGGSSSTGRRTTSGFGETRRR